jgi:hypothetical protein
MSKRRAVNVGRSVKAESVVVESVGDFRAGDRLIVTLGAKAKRGSHVLLREPDGTVRLVRFARRRQGRAEFDPAGTQQGIGKPVAIAGQMIAVVQERRRSL